MDWLMVGLYLSPPLIIILVILLIKVFVDEDSIYIPVKLIDPVKEEMKQSGKMTKEQFQYMTKKYGSDISKWKFEDD
jgi:hypothetical protein